MKYGTMGKLTGFKEFDRELPQRRPVEERLQDWKEFYDYSTFPAKKLQKQAARCMDCGVPTCHAGCPLGNLIPDWNDFVYQDRWEEAIVQLHSTNNFPEFTGRLCPAPCEEACVLGINETPVTIEEIEKNIVEHAFAVGWIKPEPPANRTGKSIAVIGSGPAGMACAQQLNRAGHTVHLYERSECVGGLMRYGIPDFKLEKRIIARRLDVMEKEGIIPRTGVDVGNEITAEDLNREYNAVVLSIGATKPRDLPIAGRSLKGVHFAMDFLTQQNKRVGNEPFTAEDILATDKNVIVIGGGDTGSDCIGTSNRHRAASVTNFELLPKPTLDRPEDQPWPFWPMRLRSSSSHEEGANRNWSILTKEFIGEDGAMTHLKTVNVEWVPSQNGGRPEMQEIEGTEKEWPCELALLALGFLGPEPDNIVAQFGCELDQRGNIKTDENYMSTVPGVFAAGDSRRGQSLIVWAISEGREAARGVDSYLMGRTELTSKEGMDLPRV
jgi:glutamate synthase (NADPH/NADH) small chain